MFERVPLEEQIKVVASIKRELNIRQNGILLYLTISGSDLYGFPSPDSDVDYRGSYITDTNNLLGMRGYEDVIEIKPDIVLFEIKKEIGLALNGNCNVLEHLNAPSIYKTTESMELVKLINNALNKKGLYDSYKGMATFNYKKFILQGKKTYKKYLYILRGLLAGIYVLQTGRIQPNIVELNKYFKLKMVDKLIKYKKEQAEESEVEDLKNSGEMDVLILKLFDEIDDAYSNSKMPDSVDLRDEKLLNEYLIKLRKQSFLRKTEI